jgi:hypothetical protein
MLMPRRLGGSFGATDGLFRVLLCRAGSQWCGAHWTANDSYQLARFINARTVHESLCAFGVFEDVPAG